MTVPFEAPSHERAPRPRVIRYPCALIGYFYSAARRLIHRYRWLRQRNVRRGSALLFPMRRRLPRCAHSRIDLTTGETLIAGPRESLLSMFEEIWIEREYVPARWTPVPDCTVVDIGANVGVFAVWAARRLGAARIVAVEPSPLEVRELRDNLRRNHLSADVLQAAVGAFRGKALLHRRDEIGALNTLFTTDRYGSRFQPGWEVDLMKLDDIFERFKIEHCDLLKIDCEGCEYAALDGANEKTLAKVRHVALEYHLGLAAGAPEALRRVLENHGFEVTVFPPRDVEGGHLHASR